MKLVFKIIVITLTLLKELYPLKLNSTGIALNIHAHLFNEILEPIHSICIFTHPKYYDVSDFVVKECFKLNKSVAIKNVFNGIYKDCKCFIFVEMSSDSICGVFVEHVQVQSTLEFSIILINVRAREHLERVAKCVSVHSVAKVVAVYLQNNDVQVLGIFTSQHFLQNSSKIIRAATNPTTLNFRGRLVNLATFHYPPFSIIRENPVQYDGMEMNLFKELSTYMNFTWRLVKLKHPQNWGTVMKNGTLTGGIFQALLEGVADVGFCNIWQRELHQSVMDFGPPLNRIYVTFIVRRPYQLDDRWLSLFAIFRADVWMTTLVTLIIVIVTFWLAHKLTTLRNKISLTESAFIIFGILTGSTSYVGPLSFPIRLVTMCWLFFSLLFATALTSCVVTRLTLPRYSPRIDSVRQLVENNYYWTDSDYGERRSFLKGFVFNLNENWQSLFEAEYKYVDPREVEKHMRSDKKIALPVQRWGDDYVIVNIKGLNDDFDLSRFRVMHESTSAAYTSFGFKKGSPLNEPLGRMILRFTENGLWAFWKNNMTAQQPGKKQLLEDMDFSVFSKPEQLTLLKLRPIFVLLLIGYVIAFCFLLVELF